MEENDYTEIKTEQNEKNDIKEINDEVKEINDKNDANEIDKKNNLNEIKEIKESDDIEENNDNKENNEIKEKNEIKEANEIKEIKEKDELIEKKEADDIKEIKVSNEKNEVKETNEIKEIKEVDEIIEKKETTESNVIKDINGINDIMEINDIEQNQNLIPIRKEKIITRKGIIITCILLFFVSILLDLYFIYLTSFKLGMKIALCIIHPLLFVIFLFIPSGLYYEFNYSNNKFIYHKTCIIPKILKICTKKTVDLDTIEKFKIETKKFLFFRIFNLYYEDKENNTIKIIQGRDRHCVREFNKNIINIPIKLNCWLKNEDFIEGNLMVPDGENPGNN